ncbi:MAG: type II secretion system F family protein [Halobacteriales archaeon]
MSLDFPGGVDGDGGIGQRRNLLGDAFFPVYRRVFDEDSTFVANLDRKLRQSRMATPVELYLSRSLGIGVLAGGGLWILGTVLGYWLFATGIVDVGPLLGAHIPSDEVLAVIQALRVPFLIAITGIIFGSIGFAAGFGWLVTKPYLRANSRAREINLLLSDAVSFMYALSVGGLNQLEIIESIAQAEDTYGEISREFQSIVYETDYFGTDYRTAIREQALLTPSIELSQFLTDMLSIINSGGDLEAFLDDKKEKHMRTAQHEQEQTLESLELFGEMYMTLSLFPLLLIVILVVMMMMGQVTMTVMYITVYALIPLTGVGFLVLVATVKKDEPGDGYLDLPAGTTTLGTERRSGLLDLGLVDRFASQTDFSVFRRIKSREGTRTTVNLLLHPHHFFLENPMYTLAVSVPTSIVFLGVAFLAGTVPTSWDAMIDSAVWGTFIWMFLPAYLILVPLGVFVEWDRRKRHSITNNLSEELRKLSSANDTGMTLLESFKTVAETSRGKLSTEFHEIHAKVSYGMTLKEALIEFNNKYHIPRLARTVKLVAKAQEASSEITDVLTTAAKTSENHDEIERERKARTRMQITIIVMTFLTMLAVIAILKVQFLDVMGGLAMEAAEDAPSVGGMGFSGSIDTASLNLLFFHAVTIHAAMSGFIAGYMREADLRSGIKYAVALMTVALAVWIVIG